MSFNGTNRYRLSAQPAAGFGEGLEKSDHPMFWDLADYLGNKIHTHTLRQDIAAGAF